MVLVHGRAAAGADQDGTRLDEQELARPHVDHQDAGDGGAVGRRHQFDGAVVLQALHAPGPDLLGQPVDDLDAGEVALVHGAVEGLPGEGLLVDGAVRVAVEVAPQFVLQLTDADLRLGHQGPGQFLVVKPLAALDGVHEVALGGIALGQRHVVAALDHPRAAGLAEQALDADRDVQVGFALQGVQRREQPGAARAQDQDVGLQRRDVAGAHPPMPILANTSARRAWPVSLTLS